VYVLVVDDDAVQRELMAAMLNAANLDHQVARDGQTAIAIARQNPPMLVLMDIRMPKMDGYQTAQAMRDDPLLQGVPILFMTAQHETLRVDQVAKLGVLDVLLKPMRYQHFVETVNRHLKKS